MDHLDSDGTVGELMINALHSKYQSELTWQTVLFYQAPDSISL